MMNLFQNKGDTYRLTPGIGDRIIKSGARFVGGDYRKDLYELLERSSIRKDCDSCQVAGQVHQQAEE